MHVWVTIYRKNLLKNFEELRRRHFRSKYLPILSVVIERLVASYVSQWEFSKQARAKVDPPLLQRPSEVLRLIGKSWHNDSDGLFVNFGKNRIKSAYLDCNSYVIIKYLQSNQLVNFSATSPPFHFKFLRHIYASSCLLLQMSWDSRQWKFIVEARSSWLQWSQHD